MIDLSAYFRRIGFTRPAAPTLECLAGIVARHAITIPFENLNPLLRRPVALDLPSLERKLVQGGRGGFCFEQNLLLRHALEAIGFRVGGLAARVVWNRPADAPIPSRGHMLLRVDLPEGVHLVDVGFGGQTMTGVLRLVPDVAQATPHEPFRLTMVDYGYLVEARVEGQWRPLYGFDLSPQFQADYELTSWYLCNHPSSHFIHNLVAARPATDRRYALRDNRFSIHHLAGGTERSVLTTASELRRALEGPIGLTLPGGDAELDALLERIASLAP